MLNLVSKAVKLGIQIRKNKYLNFKFTNTLNRLNAHSVCNDSAHAIPQSRGRGCVITHLYITFENATNVE